MIWGIEGTHMWTPPGALVPSLVMNARPKKNDQMLANGTFEVDTSGWTAFGGAVISRDVATKQTGLASMKIVAGGAGQGAEAVMRLPPGNAGSKAAGQWSILAPVGKKYKVTLNGYLADGVTLISGLLTNITGTGVWQTFGPLLESSWGPEVAFAKLIIECTEAGGFTFNADDLGVTWNRGFPWYQLKLISGLHSLGDPEDRRDSPVRREGEIPRLSYRRGKTVTYEGLIKARTLLQMRQAEESLRTAFASEEREGRMDVAPHPLNPEFVGIPRKYYEGRSLGVEIIDQQNTPNFWRQFMVAVRLSDAKFYEAEGEVDSIVTVKTDLEVSF